MIRWRRRRGSLDSTEEESGTATIEGAWMPLPRSPHVRLRQADTRTVRAASLWTAAPTTYGGLKRMGIRVLPSGTDRVRCGGRAGSLQEEPVRMAMPRAATFLVTGVVSDWRGTMSHGNTRSVTCEMRESCTEWSGAPTGRRVPVDRGFCPCSSLRLYGFLHACTTGPL